MITDSEKQIFSRASLLLGPDTLEACGSARVILFGAGGVGSWCAEGLIRSGIGHLTIVDPDSVAISNVNRQLEATLKTVGQPKADALKARLLEINPDAQISIIREEYTDATYADFHFDDYDYVIDAIDSLGDKISLLLRASASRATVYSSMGAALKVDPTKIRTAEFWNVRGCPLGAMMRKKMRKAGTFPRKKILCVYDEEVLENRGAAPSERAASALDARKAQINGSLAHITSIFGMTLAGFVIHDIYTKTTI